MSSCVGFLRYCVGKQTDKQQWKRTPPPATALGAGNRARRSALSSESISAREGTHTSATHRWNRHTVITGEQQVRAGEVADKYWPLFQYSRTRAYWSRSTWSIAGVVNLQYPRYAEYVPDRFQNLITSGPWSIYFTNLMKIRSRFFELLC